MTYRNRRYPPGHCDDCGSTLVLTARQTLSSPAEWGCPICDGGLTREEWERPDPEPDDYTYSRGVIE